MEFQGSVRSSTVEARAWGGIREKRTARDSEFQGTASVSSGEFNRCVMAEKFVFDPHALDFCRPGYVSNFKPPRGPPMWVQRQMRALPKQLQEDIKLKASVRLISIKLSLPPGLEREIGSLLF
jgi:hypothetical protein